MTARPTLLASVWAAVLLVSAGAGAEESKAAERPFTLRADGGVFLIAYGIPFPFISATFGYIVKETVAFEYSMGGDVLGSFWQNMWMTRLRLFGSSVGPSHAFTVGGGAMLWTHFGAHDDSAQVPVDPAWGPEPAGDILVGTYAYGLLELGYEYRRGPFTFLAALGPKISFGALNEHHHEALNLWLGDFVASERDHPVLPYTRIGVGVAF